MIRNSILARVGLTCLIPLALLIACAQAEAPAPAGGSQEIESAVLSYLQEVKQIDTSRMDVTVSDLEIEGDKASCSAAFTLRDDSSFPPMGYSYTLEKKDGSWSVVSSSADASNPHAAPHGETPAHGMMPDHSSVEGLPQGHPPLEQPSPEMETPQEEEPPPDDTP